MTEVHSDDDSLNDGSFDDESSLGVGKISIESNEMEFEKDSEEVSDETKALKEANISSPPISRNKILPSPNALSFRNKIGVSSPDGKVRKRKGLSLASLLQNNNVKMATSAKPMDPNSLEGQREMMAKRERELKMQAKTECIEKFSPINVHLAHWGVSSILLNSKLF